jgi:serine/threonine protein kinase
MSTSDDQERTRIQPPRPRQTGKAAPAAGEPEAEVAQSAPKTAARTPGADAPRKTPQLRNSERTLLLPQQEEDKAGQKDLLKNRFVLEKVLGAGGMGVVYKAKDLLKVEAQDRDPYVAIKVLGEEFKSHPEAFIALQRESRKTQRIAHPNIVNVHDFDKDGDMVFMTMEYLEGSSLDKVVKQYRNIGLPKDEAWPILEGLCAALSHAHSQNIIHSDLKPGNIFVTRQGVTKVFDFGIARAVAKAEMGSGDAEDRTVFDAGSFGALTPAYASLEMLEGESPDVRDDIYALGCITYELLSGTHPFQRKNAVEARRLGLKPERIDCLNKHQWRVLEQALAFERAERTPSVPAFWEGLNHKQAGPRGVLTAVAFVLLVVLAGGWLYLERSRTSEVSPIDTEEYRSEIETQIRVELVINNIRALLDSAAFDAAWEHALRQEVQTLEKLVGSEQETYQQLLGSAFALYAARIEKRLAAQEYEDVLSLIENARVYTADNTGLDSIAAIARAALTELEQQRQARLEQERLEQQRQQEQLQRQRQEAQRKQEEERRRTAYEAAMATVRAQLRCNQMLDMGDFAIAIRQLRTQDADQYRRAEPGLVDDLVVCLEKIARNFPDRALAARSAALDLFPRNARLTALDIARTDTCTHALAGLGARGRRSFCQDSLGYGGKAPETVVIPGSGNIPTFAIGRYEVRVGEINQFCIASKRCEPMAGSLSMPATGISLQLAQAYLQWLSGESGRTYRLPTLAEWQLAARANGRGLDPNRNCRLNSRGIQKGGSLLSAEIGQQNSWGLVNHVGNAREWVQGPQGLLAVGGSYATEMEDCTIEWQQSSSGSPEPETGFRVVRELSPP